jgi:tetratricopeptide (TPR) repeat protein
LAHLGGGDIHAAINTARDAVDKNPDDIAVWNLLGYLHRLSSDDSAAQEAWSTGIEHADAYADTGTCRNLRIQSWLANVEACVGHIEQARAAVARLTEADPNNGYLKYRLTHVLTELGDTEAAIKMLREAVQDGFLSVQLLQHDERLGISRLAGQAEYRRIKKVLQQNVVRVKNKYAPKA